MTRVAELPCERGIALSLEEIAALDPASIIVLGSSRVVLDDSLVAATIIISANTSKIISIFHTVLPESTFGPGTYYKDYSPHVLLPGLVDAHVHLNEPGRTEWEGFWTGTRAAAFGGVTTVIDMPLNAIPPTTTVAGMRDKVAAAKGKCWVDVGLYGGIVPGNLAELKPLIREGVRGFKGFMIDSGVEEFPAISPREIAEVFKELADEPTTVMFHAEMIPPESIPPYMDVQQAIPRSDSYQSFLDSRPSTFETCAIQEILRLAYLAPKLPLHIVHLSAMEVIPLLQKARANGVSITSETCPHYLSLAAEEIENGDTRHKCCPPIRDQSNQDGLWQEMLRLDSVIKTTVSDHSPCTPDLKVLPSSVPGSDKGVNGSTNQGDFMSAWGGISSVGLGISILWTEAMRRGVKVDEMLINIVNLCCKNTAKQVGLEHKKGTLKVGMDADIVVFDETAEFEVQPSTMLFRNKCSPYEGKLLKGVIKETWLRGSRVYSRDGGFAEGKGPAGELLLEPRTKT